MKFEELVEKARNKEIKLEDLSKEEILKFDDYDNMFLLTALREVFGVTNEEVERIKKKKGIKSYEFENYYRNALIFLDYVVETYGITNYEFVQIMSSLLNEGKNIKLIHRVELILEKLIAVDWLNINPKEEIKKLEIDVEFRNEKYISEFTYYKLLFGTKLAEIENNKNNKNTKKYKHIKKEKPKRISTVTSKYPRNQEISENALKLANYTCEYNKDHRTFIRKKNYLQYMEPHHLIPLEFQDYFEYSLDVEENIISLCSNCHNEIHYGLNNKKIIKELYNRRKNALKECGIEITLEKLYELYEIDIKAKTL